MEADALIAKGDSFYGAKNYEKAVEMYNTALSIEPSMRVYANLSVVYEK